MTTDNRQLTLFDFMIPADRQEYTNVYEFLVNLPVFFWGHQDNDLYEIKRTFIYNKEKYTLKIRRTRLSKDVDEFLTGKESDLLDTILYLISSQGTHAEIAETTGRIRARISIYKLYKTLGGKISYEDIKKGIQKLKECQLEVIPEKNLPYRVHWNCETIISQYMITDSRFNGSTPDDETYIELNSAFSNAIIRGKVKLMNFPVYMSLKNPISKYIYKQLTLFDFFSTSKERYYHNKSLFQFLENGGFMCDTTQNKNNTMYSYRKAIEELKEKGMIKDNKETAIKEGRKIIDYKLDKLVPNYNFTKENHKQRKQKRIRQYHFTGLKRIG